MSDSLQPHEPQHARPPCPSPTPGVHSNSCPLNRWYHPTISFTVVPLSSCPQSLPASGSFQMSQPFESGGQNIGVSASASVLPMNTQDCFPLGWTGWISLQPKGLSRVFSNNTVQKHQFFSAFFMVQLSHPYMTTAKTIAGDFIEKNYWGAYMEMKTSVVSLNSIIICSQTQLTVVFPQIYLLWKIAYWISNYMPDKWFSDYEFVGLDVIALPPPNLSASICNSGWCLKCVALRRQSQNEIGQSDLDTTSRSDS